jgi:dTDP-4-amino-4,6-dideoxygalactose transaminase
MLAQGTEVEAFESEFAEEVVDGVECVAVNSGTSALHLMLLAAGIGSGDEVIVPSFTFAATANSVAMTGATPVFADIEPDFFCIDPRAVEYALTPRTRAVMPVHLYGHPAALDALKELCIQKGLLLFEDAAQAHAAQLRGKPVSTWGSAGAFSFYPTKNMTAGEGGMVVTTDPDIARTVRLIRNQGQQRRYENEIVGLNNRMTDVHAAIGRVQLVHLKEWTAKRQAVAAFFNAEIKGVGTPKVAEGATHVYHQYTVRVLGHDRDRFRSELNKWGVESGVYYPIPTHRLPAFNNPQHLPNTKKATEECLSLPVHPSLSKRDLEQIVTAVNEVANAGA